MPNEPLSIIEQIDTIQFSSFHNQIHHSMSI
ncbi:hypothetical protein XM79_c20339 [Vibrio vulnificus]|nr:hypothetical protein XM74_c20156 [Vibrio vulnificus]OQK49995.1 hypothetical protein XM76_c20264 [Vibrio vulnificus]OQK60638.1 hypothetical protein XM78_c20339 [Vibrio vulnificus]OQK63347.1 hypothetical protein XM79_c20339 [Vibrio vulnificus]